MANEKSKGTDRVLTWHNFHEDIFEDLYTRAKEAGHFLMPDTALLSACRIAEKLFEDAPVRNPVEVTRRKARVRDIFDAYYQNVPEPRPVDDPRIFPAPQSAMEQLHLLAVKMFYRVYYPKKRGRTPHDSNYLSAIAELQNPAQIANRVGLDSNSPLDRDRARKQLKRAILDSGGVLPPVPVKQRAGK